MHNMKNTIALKLSLNVTNKNNDIKCRVEHDMYASYQKDNKTSITMIFKFGYQRKADTFSSGLAYYIRPSKTSFDYGWVIR